MDLVIYLEDEEEFSNVLLPRLQTHFPQHKVLHFCYGSDALSVILEKRGHTTMLVTDIALADKIDGLQVARAAMKNGVKRIFVLSRDAEAQLNIYFLENFAKRYKCTFRVKNKPEDLTTVIPLIEELLNAEF